MEKFINEETVVNNEIYQVFKDSVICPICSNILIVMNNISFFNCLCNK